ncbi:hypothetical protein HYDPIDRAFT_109547 [Hydnomerulius pinastri MD-312]|nr:hypothetical protein HYDPIDRAFT_109547 [Hydnomerulius pinastri MD-312]
MTYCNRCDRYFSYWTAFNQHVNNSSSHNICDDCDRDFPTWLGLKEHYVQSPRHHYCQQCNDLYPSHDSLITHYYNQHDYCGSCNKVFKNEHGLHEHNRQSHHYCVSCKRLFQSESNLRAHLNSSLHRPRDVSCPFRGCGLSFVSKSALALHLESGSCKSGVNRRMVDQYVRQMDRNNFITDPSRLLTAGDREVDYIATDGSWNGRAYECVLCHSLFGALRDLNRHLASPRHQDKIYRCPLDTCRMNFSTLSALCQHVESERCGVAKFRPVKDAMDRMFNGVARLTAY